MGTHPDQPMLLQPALFSASGSTAASPNSSLPHPCCGGLGSTAAEGASGTLGVFGDSGAFGAKGNCGAIGAAGEAKPHPEFQPALSSFQPCEIVLGGVAGLAELAREPT